jgi:hypothetical protein
MARRQPNEANDLPGIADGIDWAAASAQLRAAEAGDAADDVIDALTEAIFASNEVRWLCLACSKPCNAPAASSACAVQHLLWRPWPLETSRA